MHIAVVASSAPSHMHPHLAIVAELVRRGHRVGRHLTADPPSPAEIRDAILETAADAQVRLRLNAIRDQLHRVGGPSHAVDAVDDIATGRW